MNTKIFPLAIITGAALRLGRAFAFTLAKQGYAILLHYNRSRDAAESTAQELRLLGVPVFLAQADLTDALAAQGLFSVVDESAHPLKVLINSAATMQRDDARTLSISDWDLAMTLNLRAPFILAQQAYHRMSESGGGLIVNITDIAAEKAWKGFPAYTVSEAALQSLTRVLARRFAPTVRVNAIAPGLVLQAKDFPSDEWDRLVKRLPLERTAQMDELAAALEFLLKNEYITGQTITVDGGYSLI
ncbi:MAG: SDR family oxidoreductase [Anaerolineae bacterium]|jgi:pteridine reductase|nr:SDR family oxidoreductase [Anaerolineae bacterium]MBT7326358.1 SDR family oxidoreductase [Anaerolineae bacterium]